MLSDKYAQNETAWAEASISRLQAMGFNGISGCEVECGTAPPPELFTAVLHLPC